MLLSYEPGFPGMELGLETGNGFSPGLTLKDVIVSLRRKQVNQVFFGLLEELW